MNLSVISVEIYTETTAGGYSPKGVQLHEEVCIPIRAASTTACTPGNGALLTLLKVLLMSTLFSLPAAGFRGYAIYLMPFWVPQLSG